MIHSCAFFWFGSCPERSGLDRGRKNASKHCIAPKILKFQALRNTKHCNARKHLKTLQFYDLWPSSLLSLQNFRIFRALQCLVHLMSKKFRIFRALQCFVALMCAKHCNARKVLKFRSSEEHQTLQCSKTSKILKFRDLWPSSLHSLQNFRIFRVFRALKCFITLRCAKHCKCEKF